MRSLYEEGKEKIDEGRKNSHNKNEVYYAINVYELSINLDNESRKGNLAKSHGPKPKHNTNEEIGKAIGVSLYKMVSPNFPPISIFS